MVRSKMRERKWVSLRESPLSKTATQPLELVNIVKREVSRKFNFAYVELVFMGKSTEGIQSTVE
jgi:hypothetical protein